MTTTIDVPYWLKQRQANADEAGPGLWKIAGPNLADAVVGVRMAANLRWQAFVRPTADGADLETSEAKYPTARDALAAAFELYRGYFVN